MIALLTAVGLAAFTVLWAEAVHWRASRSLTSPDRGEAEPVAADLMGGGADGSLRNLAAA